MLSKGLLNYSCYKLFKIIYNNYFIERLHYANSPKSPILKIP